MRRKAITLTISLLAALLVGLPVSTLRADQNHPDLPGLFDNLKTASSLAEAQTIESQIWRRWLETDGAEAESLMKEGMLAMRYGDLIAARYHFSELIDLQPGFAEAWNKRATVNYFIGAYEASLADIDETLAREPRHFGALSGKGLVLMALERESEAAKAFEEALKIYPQMPGAKANLDYLQGVAPKI